MIDRTNPEASVSFLTLSVFAQAMAERLRLWHRTQSTESGEFLKDAIETLQRVSDSRVADVETRSGLRPFQEYGQVATLFDVLGTGTEDQARRVLDGVLKVLSDLHKKPERARQSDVQPIVQLFEQLATTALQRSRRPAESVPHGIRELCSRS